LETSDAINLPASCCNRFGQLAPVRWSRLATSDTLTGMHAFLVAECDLGARSLGGRAGWRKESDRSDCAVNKRGD